MRIPLILSDQHAGSDDSTISAWGLHWILTGESSLPAAATTFRQSPHKALCHTGMYWYWYGIGTVHCTVRLTNSAVHLIHYDQSRTYCVRTAQSVRTENERISRTYWWEQGRPCSHLLVHLRYYEPINDGWRWCNSPVQCTGVAVHELEFIEER